MRQLCWAAAGVVAALALAPATLLRAAEFDPFAGPKPLVVFLLTNPWADVIGSDTPQCVVYEGGEMVFTKDGAYRQHRLTDAELTALKQRVAALAAVKDRKDFYNRHPGVSDQPVSQFYLATGEKPFTVSVYGLVDSDELQTPAASPGGPPGKQDVLPAELVQLHKQLVGIDFKDSQPWTPKYVEVMIWPFDYAKGPTIPWPEDWPGLTSDRTVKRGDSYSIFMDYAMLPKLRELFGKRRSGTAVELGGKKWSVSARYTFPSEPVWRKAFDGG